MAKLWITIEDIGNYYQITNNATGSILFCEKGKLNEMIAKLEKGELNDEL